MRPRIHLVAWLVPVACTPLVDLDLYSEGKSDGTGGESSGAGGTAPGGISGALVDEDSLCGNGVVELGEDCDAAGLSATCRDDCTEFICPDDCECSAFEGSFLVMCAEPLHFAGAKQACNNAGFGFDIPVGEAEQAYLHAWQSRMGIFLLWLGGSDSVEEGVWQTGRGVNYWNGDSLGEPVPGVYVNWAANQPDNLNGYQHCMSQLPAGGWDDEACNLNHAYFCSVRPMVRSHCGDGEVDSGEVCDETVATEDCDADCTSVSCGDGIVNAAAGEECDDQNDESLDACNSCKKTGLLAHYPLRERIGNRAWDVASYRHHGNLLNGLTFPNDGGGLIFDGMTQYVDVPEARAPHADGMVTLAALVRAVLPLPTETTHQVIVTQRDADEETWLRLLGQTVQGGAWWGEALNAAEASLLTLWQVEEFHHLAARYDGTSWAVFHDGEMLVSQEAAVGALPAMGSLTIGGRSDGRYFAGTLRDVRFYDRALSDARIRQLAMRSLAGEIP